ncbi:MAG: hypothetical protein M3P70_07825 [Actinomycetota bacterium]|nr:hypothetical protein [Actinomycetota bacterium]
MGKDKRPSKGKGSSKGNGGEEGRVAFERTTAAEGGVPEEEEFEGIDDSSLDLVRQMIEEAERELQGEPPSGWSGGKV